MKHVHFDEVENRPAAEAGAEGVTVRWLIGPEDGAPSFYMRRFEVSPGGKTPQHTHAWEHEVYVLEGEGTMFFEGAERQFRQGDVVYVPADKEHCFRADAGVKVAFLCMIPKQCGS
jgi:quercetin dioxygenase-like cupin family protein